MTATSPTTNPPVVAAGLMLAVAGIIAVGFRGSYGPLRDAALAVHQTGPAADAYPFGIDGLIAIALVAAIVLRHNQHARRYALIVLVVFTGASLLLNFCHGAGIVPTATQQMTRPATDQLPSALVFVISALPVAAIGFGSHLLVFCLGHLLPARRQTGRHAADLMPVAEGGSGSPSATPAGKLATVPAQRRATGTSDPVAQATRLATPAAATGERQTGALATPAATPVANGMPVANRRSELTLPLPILGDEAMLAKLRVAGNADERWLAVATPIYGTLRHTLCRQPTAPELTDAVNGWLAVAGDEVLAALGGKPLGGRRGRDIRRLVEERHPEWATLRAVGNAG